MQALQAGGYPLISSTDARNKRVPRTPKVTKKAAAAAEAAHASAVDATAKIATDPVQEAAVCS